MKKPNILECTMAIRHLERFRDLVIHDVRYGHELDHVRPLEELIPEIGEETSRIEKHRLIEKEINRLILIVRYDLHRIGFESMVTIGRGEEAPEYDLIQHYFDIRELTMPDSRFSKLYQTRMRILEQAIGFYVTRRKYAFLGLLSPLNWIALVLSIPLVVLERTGIESSEKLFGEIYAWAIRIIILFLLILLAAKLGIDLSWDKLLP